MARVYKVVCQPASFYSMMYKADTIFGAFCWSIRYLEGSAALEHLLEKFKSSPPFLLSSMMPYGYMFKPLLHPPRIESNNKSEAMNLLEKEKKRKKIQFVTIDFISKYQKNLSQALISDELFQNIFDSTKIGNLEITRNAIDRITLHAREGALFSEVFLYSEMPLVFYIKVNDEQYSEGWFASIVEDVGSNGLGNDCSTGKGIFKMKLEKITQQEIAMFDYFSDNYVTLSVCTGTNLYPQFYTTFTRYGKLGGLYSQCGINNSLVYCKKPVVFYHEGSVFLGNGLGGMVNNIHQEKSIVQYGYAFPLYFG